jgi:hypothetical protein
MLPVESELHLALKVAAPEMGVNDLAAWLFKARNEMAHLILAGLLEEMQEQHLERVLREEVEIVCRGCGVIGPRPLLRRGFRGRKVRTSFGEVRFRLRQVTCGECRATWSPFQELLGLRPRQRITEELERRLVDWVTQLSYAKTSRVGGEWLGATLSPRGLHRAVQRRGQAVEFTREGRVDVVVADGTKVPAGDKHGGEEVRLAFHIQGRSRVGGRTRALKRLVSFGIGPGAWKRVLPPSLRADLIVTDAGPGLRECVRDHHPGTRHQLCEWHLGYTLGHFLLTDGFRLKERRAIVRDFMRLFSMPSKAEARARYAAFANAFKGHRRSGPLLRDAAPYVLYDDPPSEERTTSIVEREMREINRRVDVGARWSIPGVTHLLKLRLAQRCNPEDHKKLWSSTRRPTSSVVVPIA